MNKARINTANRRPAHWLALTLVVASLIGCGGVPGIPIPSAPDGAPTHRVDVNSIADAVPRAEARSRYGNPDSYVVRGQRYHVMDTGTGYLERGVASWYGTKFHGRRTSSGEPYDMYRMTAAHRSLPLPTYVRVTNLENGRSVVVRVNDRGPFHANRIIDLSYVAAAKLDMLGKGTALVEVRALDPHRPQTPPLLTAVPAAVAAPAAPAQPRLYLQVGAFSDRGNAERLAQELVQADVPSIEIHQGYRRTQPVYRVRIGPIPSVEDADRITATLSGFGIRNPQLVID